MDACMHVFGIFIFFWGRTDFRLSGKPSLNDPLLVYRGLPVDSFVLPGGWSSIHGGLMGRMTRNLPCNLILAMGLGQDLGNKVIVTWTCHERCKSSTFGCAIPVFPILGWNHKFKWGIMFDPHFWWTSGPSQFLEDSCFSQQQHVQCFSLFFYVDWLPKIDGWVQQSHLFRSMLGAPRFWPAAEWIAPG
jgi:hypothetical protein